MYPDDEGPDAAGMFFLFILALCITPSVFYVVVCVVQWMLLQWDGVRRYWEGVRRYRGLEDGRGEWSAAAVELEEGERSLEEIEEGERVLVEGKTVLEEGERIRGENKGRE
jgi:hypothetical protein